VVCENCAARARLLEGLASEIERLRLGRWELFGLLGLPRARLIEALGVSSPRHFDPLPLAAREAGVCRHDPLYPAGFSHLPCLPSACFVGGGASSRLTELLSRPVVAIVGSRRCTYYARDSASALARDLSAAGVTVVSGLSAGVEASAQHGALAGGGSPIAIMAGGAGVALPVQQDRLYGRVLSEGLVLSELPPRFAAPQPWCYLARNRLLAALAEVVVVVEAHKTSGTLFVAEVALRLGRDIAVLPGRAYDASAAGSNALLRDGASIVLDASDVLSLLGGVAAPVAA
jgi:DNA processing protein